MMRDSGLVKIISGGQTGVDRAALDAASKVYLVVGGWCPYGRKAENGIIPDTYPLTETPSPDYPQRTEWNVRDSDGSLIITMGEEPAGGLELTIALAGKMRKPCCIVSILDDGWQHKVREWVHGNHIRVLNVAGSKESEAPGIHQRAFIMLCQLFHDLSSRR